MGARLLLADDSVTIQRVIELTFADEDVTVIAVGDGDAAIARLETDPPDIVLADIGMPGRDGYEVAAHVKATPRLAHIPVLLLAGAFEPVDEERVAQTGCAGVLVKPFEPQMVIARVRQLLDARSAGPPSGGASAPDPEALAQIAPGAPAAPRHDASARPELGGAPPKAAATSVEDYFERLDAAFASINAQVDEARPRAGREDATLQQAPAAEAARPAPGGGVPPRPREAVEGDEPPSHAEGPFLGPDATRGGGPLSMADAFDALLGIEQGGPPPVLPEAWAPIVSDDLVEQVARRIADQVADRVVHELAPDIVTRVAERVVREEIAKLRAEAEARS